jgi:hypothetical protein
VSAGNPCWARAELIAATTAAAIDAAAVDPPPLGDGAGGAGAGGRGGAVGVERGTSAVLDAEVAGVLAARLDAGVACGRASVLTWGGAAAWLDDAVVRDDPVPGAAAMGAAAVDVPGRALGCGLPCSAQPATAAVVAPARTMAAIAATLYRIPAVDRRRRRCRPPAPPFDDIGPQSWPR